MTLGWKPIFVPKISGKLLLLRVLEALIDGEYFETSDPEMAEFTIDTF
jgi:hypothetical protein